MTKATVETLKLIFIIALGLIIFLYLIPMMLREANIACKRSQIDELSRVLRELDKFERMKTTLQPGSYNIVENFEVKTCTDKIEYKDGLLYVIWNDGSSEKIPTKAQWKMDDSFLSLKEGKWDMKVSLESVTAIRKK
jgi:uncharacterized LabA/DUF88 family protein